MKVSVPQKDGEITIRQGWHEPKTWSVTDGQVDVSDQDEADLFLAAIDGSSLSNSPASAGTSASAGSPSSAQ